jgi:hypothetical protein
LTDDMRSGEALSELAPELIQLLLPFVSLVTLPYEPEKRPAVSNLAEIALGQVTAAMHANY